MIIINRLFSNFIKFLSVLPGFLTLFFMIVCMVIAQILYKMAGEEIQNKLDLISIIGNVWIWFGLITSSVGMVFWLLTLRKLPLSVAYPWTASIYVFTPVFGFFCFNEIIGYNYFIGLLFIVIGIAIISRSTSE